MSVIEWETVSSPAGATVGGRIAMKLRAMVLAHEASRDRSQQSAEMILGPSQIGDPCARCLARYVLGRPVTRAFDDPWCRYIGTAVHDYLSQAADLTNATAAVVGLPAPYLIEHRVHPDDDLMPRGGHLDLYDHAERTIIDHKVVGPAPHKRYRNAGPGPQYRRQAHVYGWGLTLAGYPVEHVAVAFWLRGGRLSDLHVWTEPYSEDVVEEALSRFAAIRDLARQLGPAVLPMLPADPECYECEGRPVSPEELVP